MDLSSAFNFDIGSAMQWEADWDDLVTFEPSASFVDEATSGPVLEISVSNTGNIGVQKVASLAGLRPNVPRQRKRFDDSARIAVRGWLDQHQDDPYPTKSEKEKFSITLGLSVQQVSTLFNNERRRYKNSATNEIDLSLEHVELMEKHLVMKENPILERYLSSSSDEDPQPSQLVARAAMGAESWSTFRAARQEPASAHTFMTYRDVSSRSDTSASNSAHSQASVRSVSSRMSGKRGKRKVTTRRQSLPRRERYYCTYCWKYFSSAYVWKRHERTVHNPESIFECRMWELLDTPPQQSGFCKACSLPEVDDEHNVVNAHPHLYTACKGWSKDARTFTREDHFRQHLNNIHNAEYTSHMVLWSQPTWSEFRPARCGFCGELFPTWSDRLTHIHAVHYHVPDHRWDRSKWTLEYYDDELSLRTSEIDSRLLSFDSHLLKKLGCRDPRIGLGNDWSFESWLSEGVIGMGRRKDEDTCKF